MSVLHLASVVLLAVCWRAVDLFVARCNLDIARLNLLGAWLNLNAARHNHAEAIAPPAPAVLNRERERINEHLYTGMPLSEWMETQSMTQPERIVTKRRSLLSVLQQKMIRS